MNGYGYMLASIVGTLVTSGVGIWAYKRRAQVDIETRKKTSEIDAQAAPAAVYKTQLDKRDAELAEERKQSKEERAKSLETLGAIRIAMETLVKDLAAHREEERSRSNGVHERLDQFGDRLLIIETQLGTKRSA